LAVPLLEKNKKEERKCGVPDTKIKKM